ncbi:hypothetical protein FRC09_004034 [Ceratobasidium sp. 395]|nr:hypothetical protein FRC09_004034 [Ceratobasidium sp. 395]
MSMSNDFQVLQTASRLVDYSGVADVTNLVEWSFCNAVEVHSEYSNVEYFVTRLRVGPPITVRSPRTFLSERLSGKTRVLQETEKSILAWSKYHHENVAEVFGIARFRDQIVIVTFGAEIVALPAYLTRNPSADKLRISLQITSGAVYLHSLGAVHHAVKASNVEVDSGGVAKLAGFDSFYNDLTTDYSTQSIETSLWWMAPEQLLGTQSHTIESNVYALGMTILEIFTGKRPYAEIPNFASLVRQLVSDRIFPRRPFWLTPGSSDTDNQLWQLLLNCWDRDPQARPATAYIQRQLDRLQQDYAALRCRLLQQTPLPLAEVFNT